MFAVRPRLTILAAALLPLTLAPGQARALELFGFCLSGECKKAEQAADLIDPRVYVANLQVETPPAEEFAAGVDDTVRSASQLWQGRDAAVAGSAGLVTRAKGDYRRILAGLQGVGHYGASVSIRIDGREAAELPPGFEVRDGAQVDIRVDTGPLFTFGAAEIANRAPPPDDPGDIVQTPEEAGFAPGAPAGADAIRVAARLSREAWREQGHPKATVEVQSVRAFHPERRLDARLAVTPGPRAVFGAVTVNGTRRMDPGFVAYMTGIPAGAEFDPDEIDKAKRRLDRLGVFSTRRIEEAEAVQADGSLPLAVIVDERKPRRIGAGATLSSIDGAGLEGYFLHRNLFGKAESLKLEAKVGGLGQDFAPDRLDYSVLATFTRPGAFSPDTDFVSTLGGQREVNETYTETSASGTAGFVHYLDERSTFKGGIFAKQARFEDAFGRRDFTTTGLYGEAVYDRRDDKLEPTEGYYLSGGVKPFYEWQFGNPAVRFEAEARGYLGFGPDNRTVLAARARTGALIGPDTAQLPADLLFLEGGGGSVRGYAYRNIGVDTPAGIVGGRSMATFSGEIRQRLNDSFGLVAFADAGTVSASQFIDFSEPMKVGVGAGIRYYTGLGAIRLDVAVPLDAGNDDPSFGIYAGIGQAF